MPEIQGLAAISRAAEALLAPLAAASSEQLIALLKPRDEDYARIFLGPAVEAARAGYAELWLAPPRGLAKPGQTVVRAVAADAAALATENELSREFPGGYRQIAHLLAPSLVWVQFRFTAPGEASGMAHDGLVQLGERWAWFPKPWRILGRLV